MRTSSSAKAKMDQALATIKAMISDPDLSPSALAGEAGLVLPVFSRAFKQVTGMTCTDYVTRERINLAKRLLRTDTLLIKEIAIRAGFRDPNYLSRRFREIEGCSPSSYRRLTDR